VGYSISLRFFFQAYPTASSVNGWTFVNTNGSIQDLPGSNTRSDSNSPFSLGFIFLSEAYYGNYSITLGNTIGSITETFQVIRPSEYYHFHDLNKEHIHHVSIYIYMCIYIMCLYIYMYIYIKYIYILFFSAWTGVGISSE